MAGTVRPDPSRPIVDDLGLMEQPYRYWVGRVNDALPITGEGSPEGLVDAPQLSLYIDINGTTGTIEYRKMLPDIGGDTKQGWLLV